jgi:hypothetical protein
MHLEQRACLLETFLLQQATLHPYDDYMDYMPQQRFAMN